MRKPAETYEGRVCAHDGTTERYVKHDHCKACKLKAAKARRDEIREALKNNDVQARLNKQKSLNNWV